MTLTTMPAPVRVGFNLYPQETSFEQLVAAAVMADTAGCDSIWIWDHLYGVTGPEQAVFETWSTLGALARETKSVTLGTLVASNTFRNPGLLAKCAVTVDHASAGRLVLGVGAGYQEAEHAAFGIPVGSSREERIGWLEESLSLLVPLLQGEVVSARTNGRYVLDGAVVRPLPTRGHGSLPLMIGGGSPGMVQLVARFADYWHTRGSVASLARRLTRLRNTCTVAGRDPGEITLCIGNPVIIRDDPDEALSVYKAALAHNAQTLETAPGEPWMGPPTRVAELWRPYLELGFRCLIADLPSPHDAETLQRLPDVRELVCRG